MYFCVVLCTVCFVSFSVLFVCVYMCTELLPPGGYPIAVKYIMYHIINVSANNGSEKLLKEAFALQLRKKHRKKPLSG